VPGRYRLPDTNAPAARDGHQPRIIFAPGYAARFRLRRCLPGRGDAPLVDVDFDVSILTSFCIGSAAGEGSACQCLGVMRASGRS
jgi:hypothetical protein